MGCRNGSQNIFAVGCHGHGGTIEEKEISPSELIELSFEQQEKVNPTLNAVVHTRKEKVIEEAKKIKIDDRPFAGVPILLKNISQSLKNEPLTSGARLFQSFISEQDSNFVAKIREAGFLFTGHTNTPEFGLKNITEPQLHGATRNPWNPQYSAGGSSGGSAASIAAGIVPMAGASDGGGSIRIPASFSGLFGLKPTRGRMPVGPGVGRQWQGASIDFVLSRSVRDSAAMLDALQVFQQSAAFNTPLLAGNSVELMNEAFPKPLKIAYTTKSPVGTPVSNEAVLAVEKIVKWLEKEGHIVEERENDVDGVQLMKDYFLMNSGEMSTLMRQLESALGRSITEEDIEIETWMLNEAGKTISAAQFSASLASWDVAAAHMAELHETYDFYITPATAFSAPEIGELTFAQKEQENLREQMNASQGSDARQALIWDMFLPSLTYTPFTQLANLTGQPAISLPVHLSKDGLPLGVQVMAQKGEERRLLQLAAQLEETDLWVGMTGNPLFE